MNTVVDAAPAVGAVEPGAQVAVGEREDGHWEGVPTLLHSKHDEPAAVDAAGLRYHGMKQLQIEQAPAVGFEARGQVGHR